MAVFRGLSESGDRIVDSFILILQNNFHILFLFLKHFYMDH